MVIRLKSMRLLACTTLVATTACTDPVQPGAEVVAGRYTADVLEYIREDAPSVSLLATESHVEISIRRNGTFDASLTVPVALAGYYASPVQVHGRWSISDGTLTLTGEPGTFLDVTSFPARGDGYLYGQALIDEVLVRMRLVKVNN